MLGKALGSGQTDTLQMNEGLRSQFCMLFAPSPAPKDRTLSQMPGKTTFLT